MHLLRPHHLATRRLPPEAARAAEPLRLGEVRLRVLEIRVETRVFERDRRLRGQRLQQCDARRREDMRGDVVLDDEARLLDEREAQRRADVGLHHVGVRREGTFDRRIIDDDRLMRSKHVVQDRLGEIRWPRQGSDEAYSHCVPLRGRFRLEPCLLASPPMGRRD